MKSYFKQIIDTVEPLEDSIYGPRYRCSLTFNDGIHLPCAILQSKERILELAKRRIKEEMPLMGSFGNSQHYEKVLESLVISGNKINDYDVIDAKPSPYAIPLDLLSQIQGETTMGWTGWVFEMTDRSYFTYGTQWAMEFFQLPEGYSFGDVLNVHNHSYISQKGELTQLKRGGLLPENYLSGTLFREKAYFICAIDGI